MDDCQSVKQKRAKRRSNLPNFQLIRTGRFIECEDDSKIFFLESTIKNPKANIIIVTPFGKTIHDMFLITFYLNYNGFNVYRFDPRDHVGMSSGDIEDFGLYKVEKDLEKCMQHFNFDKSVPTIILGMSLSFPVALKYASLNSNIHSLISIVGVVNPDDTSYKVTNIDPNEFRKPVITAPAYSEPFGCRIKNKKYVEGLDNGGYSKLSDIIGFGHKLTVPLYMIVAEKDQYVSLSEVKEFFSCKNSGGEMVVMEGVSHEIGRSISAAKTVASLVVEFSMKSINMDTDTIQLPSLVEVISESERESEYINNFEK